MNKLIELMESRNIENEGTKSSYTYSFKKAVEHFAYEEFWIGTEKRLMILMDDFNIPKTARYQMANLIIMLRKMEDRPINKLTEYRRVLHNSIRADTKEKMDTTVLPDYENYFCSIYKYRETNMRKFIINKLIQYFGLRNLDLMICFKKMGRGKRVLDDKTKASFGRKIIKITKDKYPDLCRTIQKYFKEGNTFLLAKKNKEEIKRNALHDYITLYTDGLGTSKLFKMIIFYWKQKGDLNKIKELSDSRGTSIETIITNYNISNNGILKLEKDVCYLSD